MCPLSCPRTRHMPRHVRVDRLASERGEREEARGRQLAQLRAAQGRPVHRVHDRQVRKLRRQPRHQRRPLRPRAQVHHGSCPTGSWPCICAAARTARWKRIRSARCCCCLHVRGEEACGDHVDGRRRDGSAFQRPRDGGYKPIHARPSFVKSCVIGCGQTSCNAAPTLSILP